jgi:ketosteroid isomerase-like protein
VDQSKQTEATLAHHMQAFGSRDVDAILQDFTPDSVIFCPDGPMRGLEAIRGFFVRELEVFTPEILNSIKVVRQDIDGEVAYLAISAGATLPLATDTYIVRNGKIMVETTAAYMGRIG